MIVSIPLLDKLHKCESFDIYSSFSSVAIKNPKVADDNVPNMVAWYNIEAKLIAVNLDQMNVFH